MSRGSADLSLARRSHPDDRTSTLDSVEADNGTGVRGVDHQAGSHVHPHMLDCMGRRSEEYKIAGFDRGSGRNGRPSIELVLGYPRKTHPGFPVDELHQPRAVEAPVGGLSTPQIRDPDQCDGTEHRRHLAWRFTGHWHTYGADSDKIATDTLRYSPTGLNGRRGER